MHTYLGLGSKTDRPRLKRPSTRATATPAVVGAGFRVKYCYFAVVVREGFGTERPGSTGARRPSRRARPSRPCPSLARLLVRMLRCRVEVAPLPRRWRGVPTPFSE